MIDPNIDKAYREAIFEWDMHKHDCPMCGTFGEPGCDMGEPLWRTLCAIAQERREQEEKANGK